MCNVVSHITGVMCHVSSLYQIMLLIAPSLERWAVTFEICRRTDVRLETLEPLGNTAQTWHSHSVTNMSRICDTQAPLPGHTAEEITAILSSFQQLWERSGWNLARNLKHSNFVRNWLVTDVLVITGKCLMSHWHLEFFRLSKLRIWY